MADDQEDEASRLLKKILSPAEAQSLVLPPPNHPPVAACSANPTSVFAGSNDAVTVHVNASDPDNDPLTYSYTASGGAVEGTGPDARFNTAGLAEGSYSVTAKVDDGKGGTATCAADITVAKKPNQPPTISCATDRSPIMPGERTGITATASDPDGDPLTYSYSATAGQVSGDGPKAQFDSTGLAPGSYTVSAAILDSTGSVHIDHHQDAYALKVTSPMHGEGMLFYRVGWEVPPHQDAS